MVGCSDRIGDEVLDGVFIFTSIFVCFFYLEEFMRSFVISGILKERFGRCWVVVGFENVLGDDKR